MISLTYQIQVLEQVCTLEKIDERHHRALQSASVFHRLSQLEDQRSQNQPDERRTCHEQCAVGVFALQADCRAAGCIFVPASRAARIRLLAAFRT